MTDRDLDQLAGYFTKQGAEGDRLAWELTGADTKTASKTGSMSPLHLLVSAASGNAEHLARFREYEQATKRRRLFETSKGLRELLAVPALSESRDCVAEPALVPSEWLLSISRREFERLSDRPGMLSAVAQLIEGGALPEELLWWLSDRGIRSDLAPPAEPPPVLERVEAPPGAPAWLALP